MTKSLPAATVLQLPVTALAGAARPVPWDLDGTLPSSGRLTREAFSLGLTEVYGTAGDLAGYRFEGKIDPAIVARGRERALSRYLDRLEAILD